MWWCSGEMCCLVASPQPDDLSDIDFYVDHFDTQMTEKYSTAICSGGMCCLVASTQAAFLQPAVAPRPPSHPPTHRPLSLYKRPLPNCDPLSPARNHSSTSIGVKRKCQRVSPVVFHSCDAHFKVRHTCACFPAKHVSKPF